MQLLYSRTATTCKVQDLEPIAENSIGAKSRDITEHQAHCRRHQAPIIQRTQPALAHHAYANTAAAKDTSWCD